MKRIVILLLSLVFAYGADPCLKVAQDLWKLQNSIIEHAFLGLAKGTWARYDDGSTMVYVGQDTIEGQKLYGAEWHYRDLVMQMWYRIITRNKVYAGKKYPFRLLDPQYVYIFQDSTVIRLNAAQMRMMGSQWSHILSWGFLEDTPPDCTHNQVVTVKKERRTIGDKSVAVYKVVGNDGGYVMVSDEVPFGYVEAGDSSGVGTPRLVAFGEKGKIRITHHMRSSAMPVPMMPMMPMPMGGAK